MASETTFFQYAYFFNGTAGISWLPTSFENPYIILKQDALLKSKTNLYNLFLAFQSGFLNRMYSGSVIFFPYCKLQIIAQDFILNCVQLFLSVATMLHGSS